jgi:hypothetical protein
MVRNAFAIALQIIRVGVRHCFWVVLYGLLKTLIMNPRRSLIHTLPFSQTAFLRLIQNAWRAVQHCRHSTTQVVIS